MVQRAEHNSLTAQASVLPDHKFDTMHAKCAILHLYMDEDVEEGEFSETPEDYESRADVAEGDNDDGDCPRATTSPSQS